VTRHDRTAVTDHSADLQASVALARDGFIVIRWCLQHGYTETATAIAEALHNLPEPGNEFQKSLCLHAIRNVLLQHSDKPAVRSFLNHLPHNQQQEIERINTDNSEYIASLR